MKQQHGEHSQQRLLRWRCVLVFVMLGMLLGGSACQQRILDDPRRPEHSEEEVLALLSVARSHHRRAQLLLTMKQSDQALAEMDRLLQLRFPPGFRPGQEALLDAWARKATMLLSLRRSQEALLVVEQGIRQSSLKRSFYLAHLHHVQGQILEDLGRQREALAAYQQSIAINQQVIQAARQRLQPGSPTRPASRGTP